MDSGTGCMLPFDFAEISYLSVCSISKRETPVFCNNSGDFLRRGLGCENLIQFVTSLDLEKWEHGFGRPDRPNAVKTQKCI